jgi:hypothetical protein
MIRHGMFPQGVADPGDTEADHTLSSQSYGLLQQGMSSLYTVDLTESATSPAMAVATVVAGDENRSTSIALNINTILNLVTEIIPPRG